MKDQLIFAFKHGFGYTHTQATSSPESVSAAPDMLDLKKNKNTQHDPKTIYYLYRAAIKSGLPLPNEGLENTYIRAYTQVWTEVG